MERLPVATQPSPPAFARGDSQERQHYKCAKSNGDIGPFDYISPYAVPVEKLVQDNISKDMHAGVKIGKQPQHAAIAHNLRFFKDDSKRRDCQGQQEKS